jgi:3-mercaptopyruvate sulfurtransferase SseA
VWDCRSAEEFRGQKSGSARAGHIPGAVHLDWLDLMDRARALRLRTDLEALLAERGIDRGRDVVTHCQTHHRSGLSYLVARLLDFPRIRAYPGSWSEWGNRTDTPVATGP